MSHGLQVRQSERWFLFKRYLALIPIFAALRTDTQRTDFLLSLRHCLTAPSVVSNYSTRVRICSGLMGSIRSSAQRLPYLMLLPLMAGRRSPEKVLVLSATAMVVF